MAATRARHVYLDVTHLGAAFVKRRFPTIYATCLRYDIDMTEEWIPVSPSAHYMMGGGMTDVHGATTLPGLYAAGSCVQRGTWGESIGQQLAPRRVGVRHAPRNLRWLMQGISQSRCRCLD